MPLTAHAGDQLGDLFRRTALDGNENDVCLLESRDRVDCERQSLRRNQFLRSIQIDDLKAILPERGLNTWSTRKITSLPAAARHPPT